MRVPRWGGKPNTKGGRCCLCGVPLTDVAPPLLLPDEFWRQDGTGLLLTTFGFVIVVGEAEPMPDVDCTVGSKGNCEELLLLVDEVASADDDDGGDAAKEGGEAATGGACVVGALVCNEINSLLCRNT